MTGVEHRRPGRLTRAVPRALAFLRDRGLPFLAGADDAALRALALGIRAATKRTLAGPLPAPADGDHEARFAPLADGDDVRLLAGNREAFEARCALAASATRTLDCALFYLADDATGAAFAGILRRAAERGVRVRLGVDAFASVEKHYGPSGFGAAGGRGALALLGSLREGGCETHLLGADGWCMHRKFLLVDGERLLFGGRNVADHYATPGWRDLELLLAGPFARSFGPVVEATFASPTWPPPAVAGVIAGAPGQAGRAFRRAVVALVDRARASVDIEHAYVLQHPWLVDALAGAVRRGVRVRVLTNSGPSNDLPFMTWRQATAVRELADRGVVVARRTTPAATLHTKLVVGDRRQVVFGSSNLDYYSPAYCAELDMAVESDALGAALTDLFEEGLAEPTTELVVAGSRAAAAVERERNPWSVSRAFDLVMRDIQ